MLNTGSLVYVPGGRFHVLHALPTDVDAKTAEMVPGHIHWELIWTGEWKHINDDQCDQISGIIEYHCPNLSQKNEGPLVF